MLSASFWALAISQLEPDSASKRSRHKQYAWFGKNISSLETTAAEICTFTDWPVASGRLKNGAVQSPLCQKIRWAVDLEDRRH